MCAGRAYEWGTYTPIPDLEVVRGTALTETSTGAPSACAQCSDDSDCVAGETCSTAGVCE